MELLLVGIGGAFGAIARFRLGKWISGNAKTPLPIGTFVINMTGALLLGFLVGLDMGRSVYLLLGEGFLGAYTTFSTFLYEGFHLFGTDGKRNAAVYIAGSLVLGIAGYAAGFQLGGLF